jgi:hypothetical protein
MNREDRIQKEVDKTLNLMDSIGKVSAREGFAEQVIQKMKAEGRTGFSPLLPAIAAGMVLLIGLNVFSIFYKNNTMKSGMKQENPVGQFYQLNQSGDIYDQFQKR